MVEDKILTISGIGKSFGGLTILKDISLEVEKGERIGIIGPNGAGKTTFFNLLVGDIKPTHGKIFHYNKNITKQPNYLRAQNGIARTFQKNNLLNELSVLENLLLVLQRRQGYGHKWFNRREEKQYPDLYLKAYELLETWGLSHRREVIVKSLSYGEQRQIEILLGIASDPSILLLDEPTAGMSQSETNYIVKLLYGLPRELTLMVIEHDLDVVFGLADRMVVLNDGEVLTVGEPDTVRKDERVNKIYIGTGDED
ncbi:ABC transporter ATP-binding protein [Aquibacillus sp. 3ASR75-11]|uniref:ABC transporter ATP-binding protein n=1 Tax=Terrihalobacillus insolitus TaxID=2950438 RepID=A0A9X4AN16_9BACI|nr:ABC transporter ATP-binding protein [Terrihalobacillus insolitus]MDC3413984.1 ABC transporter ATP-binding protein [Terrihalobacillus insolitus]MDC3424073.1 ABC transporter ATP-binding protein [Terrihalobacillus insolitus]